MLKRRYVQQGSSLSEIMAGQNIAEANRPTRAEPNRPIGVECWGTRIKERVGETRTKYANKYKFVWSNFILRSLEPLPELSQVLILDILVKEAESYGYLLH